MEQGAVLTRFHLEWGDHRWIAQAREWIPIQSFEQRGRMLLTKELFFDHEKKTDQESKTRKTKDSPEQRLRFFVVNHR